MSSKCDACGEEENQYIVNQRFHAGRWDVEGYDKPLKTLCDDCHREIVRT